MHVEIINFTPSLHRKDQGSDDHIICERVQGPGDNSIRSLAKWTPSTPVDSVHAHNSVQLDIISRQCSRLKKYQRMHPAVVLIYKLVERPREIIYITSSVDI